MRLDLEQVREDGLALDRAFQTGTLDECLSSLYDAAVEDLIDGRRTDAQAAADQDGR